MNKILIIKDSVKKSNDHFIYCSPFHTISCIDKNIISLINNALRILITSRNGAIALMYNISTFGCNFKNKEIITIGSKTHALLEKNGFTNLIGPYYNIQSLIAQIDLSEVLYLSGADTSFLNYQHYGVQREIIYKSIEKKIPADIIDQVMLGYISHVLLYSPRGATIFLQNFPTNYNFNGIDFICISKSVADIVTKYNPRFPNIPLESEMLSLIH